MEFITVLFTCQGCGLQRVRVPVRARGRDEDVVKWVEFVAQKCGERHKAIMPGCPTRKLDLAIPAPAAEDDGIGMSAPELPAKLSGDFMASKAAN